MLVCVQEIIYVSNKIRCDKLSCACLPKPSEPALPLAYFLYVLSKLQCLNINGCVRLEELPNVAIFGGIEPFWMQKAASIPGLRQLKKLIIYIAKLEELYC